MAQGNLSVVVLYIKDSPKWAYEKPFFLSDSESYDSEIITNFEGDRRVVSVWDIRGRENSIRLDEHGFCFKKHSSGIDLREVKGQDTLAYAQETIGLLKDDFSSSIVICYDVRRRSSTKLREKLEPVLENTDGKPRRPAPPVYRVHADHTVNGGFHRARRHLSDAELDLYVKSGKWRIRIINTWRPIKEVKSSPLAFLDYRTVSLNDLIETDAVNTEYVGENYCVKYNPSHQFYWLSQQHPDELCIFTAFDSQNASLGLELNTCPHTAFELPNPPKGAPVRESIETRSFVITPLEQETHQIL